MANNRWFAVCIVGYIALIMIVGLYVLLTLGSLIEALVGLVFSTLSVIHSSYNGFNISVIKWKR
ncbi:MULTISPECIES: hypothetical protein [Acidiplasma]|uniref:Uncharacterized protein n=2 Tax=Acidiplasma TaxID=507753 RepID=A0A0Q0RLY8_9ARCH|nr:MULTISPECIES: hypothetical protein [Acidiplasma]KPV44795.1 hypothetical protein SE19_08595 [Acidiplasma aeolicum]KQB36773.1 hypothetical protein AOG55_03225 [Acidiplasma cupricumulans]